MDSTPVNNAILFEKQNVKLFRSENIHWEKPREGKPPREGANFSLNQNRCEPSAFRTLFQKLIKLQIVLTSVRGEEGWGWNVKTVPFSRRSSAEFINVTLRMRCPTTIFTFQFCWIKISKINSSLLPFQITFAVAHKRQTDQKYSFRLSTSAIGWSG